jgi:signal transduction histidine kinase
VKRKLTVRTKLAATLAVPLVALASFAALQVRDAYNRSDQVRLQAGVATSATGPAGALSALENERDYEALRVIGAQNLVAPKSTKFASHVTATTDVALGNFRLLLGQAGGEAAGNYRSTLSQVSTGLLSLRQRAKDHTSTSATPESAKQASVIFDGYTRLIDRLLDADQRSSATIDDADLRSGAELLNAIARQSDTESGIAIKVGLAAVTHDSAAFQDALRLADLQAAGDADLHLRADGRFEQAVMSALDAPARKKAVAQLQAAAHNPAGANLISLLKTRPASINLLRVAQSNVTGVVDAQASTLTSAARNEERNWIALTIASVLLAIALMWLTNRWITRPLRLLADQATAMASERLPAAVQQILATPVDEEVVQPKIDPVHVRAGGEVHDVEVALNKVQDSAVGLAVEQASLRRNVADAYVNLGRRNQNLLSRQLEFITQLEAEESDPETLEHLFRLDHLATRMRRNAESLLVLAGLAPPRTWSAPVPMGDVVRGALGEVEGYQRVRLRQVDDARVDGAAAADVSHVIAELVENALSFSPPDADVEIYGRKDDRGYVISIVDSGIGMHDEDLARANALISSANTLTMAPSRFLGHYVVAQLAARHGLGIHLGASPTGGLTATIGLPLALLGAKEAPAPSAAAPAPVAPTSAVQSAPAAGRPAALPRRGTAPADAAPAAPAPPPAAPPVTPPAPDVPVSPIAFRAPAPPPPLPPELTPDEDAFDFDAIDADFVDDDIRVEQAPPGPAPTVPGAPTVSPAPQEPARPRLGLGSFADLRGATAPPGPDAAPAPVDQPVASASPSAPEPDLPPLLPSDKRASFAEVAQAVDNAARPAEAEPVPGSVFAEDFLPQRLPKRGRRSSRLETPWVRERAAVSTPPPASLANPLPAQPGAPQPSANGAGVAGAHSTPLPSENGNAPAPNGAATPSADGGDRYAFFAAFRAAAETAREEAGIDDRRGS